MRKHVSSCDIWSETIVTPYAAADFTVDRFGRSGLVLRSRRDFRWSSSNEKTSQVGEKYLAYVRWLERLKIIFEIGQVFYSLDQ